MNQIRKRLVVTAGFSTLAALALASSPASHEATAAEAFGPVESRTFLSKPGASIEIPGADCGWNIDYLFIKGPNVASVKQVDVAPNIWTKFNKGAGAPTTDCAAPNCVQITVSTDKRTAAGPRTVTLKHNDGRTITTTFDAIPNAGRCDRR
jgi:hypothetical protein